MAFSKWVVFTETRVESLSALILINLGHELNHPPEAPFPGNKARPAVKNVKFGTNKWHYCRIIGNKYDSYIFKQDKTTTTAVFVFTTCTLMDLSNSWVWNLIQSQNESCLYN